MLYRSTICFISFLWASNALGTPEQEIEDLIFSENKRSMDFIDRKINDIEVMFSSIRDDAIIIHDGKRTTVREQKAALLDIQRKIQDGARISLRRAVSGVDVKLLSSDKAFTTYASMEMAYLDGQLKSNKTSLCSVFLGKYNSRWMYESIHCSSQGTVSERIVTVERAIPSREEISSIESRIVNEFNGWDGDTIVQLENGGNPPINNRPQK